MKYKKISMLIQVMIFILLASNSETMGQTSGQQGPSGGTGGYNCNTTYLGGRLISITVRSGTYIDAIDLKFDTKTDPPNVVCGGSGGSPKTLVLIEGEYIFRVTGRYNKFVEYLRIQTAGTRYQTLLCGNTSSTAPGYFDYQTIEGIKIANLVVKAGQYVDAIGVIIQKN